MKKYVFSESSKNFLLKILLVLIIVICAIVALFNTIWNYEFMNKIYEMRNPEPVATTVTNYK